MAGCEVTDVIICGAGPTGAMLSGHLGKMGVRNIILDKEADITTDPRGIALDEDGIRALQSLGIYDAVHQEIGQCMGIFNFIGGVHQNLTTRPFMRMDYNTSEGGTGHVGFICHKQPILEKHLRKVIAATPCSDFRPSSTLTSISEDESYVYATYLDLQGTEHKVKARFLVGADGKTGYTRKKYLEPKGIVMEQASSTSYEETWVALNWSLKLPTEKTHPNFPLWSRGYTPEQVYDLFFPKEFRFLCNPQRPAVCGRFGLPEDRLWRFEFVVRKGENGNELATNEKVREIVHPYITHPGKRYNLLNDVEYPSDCITTLRSRPFVFSARSCNKWALGRVILCGDSAHVFPPFGGQGIASGFRDACALAWRLQIACRPGIINHEKLLSAWYRERKQQLERSLAATVENGQYVTESNPIRIFIRDMWLSLVQWIPSWRRWLEQGARRDGMTRYKYEQGMSFLPSLNGGICFPQVYCVPLKRDSSPRVESGITFTDDLIFAPDKKGIFQLVLLPNSAKDVEPLLDIVKEAMHVDNDYVYASEATCIIQSTHTIGARAGEPDMDLESTRNMGNVVARIATAEEFAESKLCYRRPSPKYYDEHRLPKEVGGKKIVILRPDRFVFAACADATELRLACSQIGRGLQG